MIYAVLLLLAAAWAYQFLALVSLYRFSRTPPPGPPTATGPGITVFKPLKEIGRAHV